MGNGNHSSALKYASKFGGLDLTFSSISQATSLIRECMILASQGKTLANLET